MIIQEREEDFKKLVKQNINDALKNKAEFVSEPVRKKFSEFLLSLFEKALETENTKKVFQKAANELFGKLDEKIKAEKNTEKKMSRKKKSKKNKFKCRLMLISKISL